MFSFLNPLPQLPKYRGAYKVGSCEYEIPVSEIPSETRIPDANVTTIKFRVYYPTAQDAKSKTPIPWLPTPQKEGNRAYAKFLGLSERSSGVVANLPSMLSYPTLPAVYNAPLSVQKTPFPVAIFSHGLGGNFNTYSSFVGSLASCGVIVFAPEHRDQSAPISFIRSSGSGPGRPVPYRRLSHTPSVEVLNARNDMLRIRSWELEKLFTAISEMNEGRLFTNYADATSGKLPSFQGALDLRPSKITWAGHSFGAATTVQFIKSVYYRQHAPPAREPCDEKWDYTPLYSPSKNAKLSSQITAESPIVLLDLWTMPLTAKSTSWLWEKPLPCYDRQRTSEEGESPNVVSVMSAQFYKWPEIVDRTKALLSPNPVEAYRKLSEKSSQNREQVNLEETEAQEPSPQLSLDPITKLETSKTAGLQKAPEPDNSSQLSVMSQESAPRSKASTRTPSPARSVASSANEAAQSTNSSVSSLPLSTVLPNTKSSAKSGVAPQLYLVPTSAHLSQSDFGVLFPNVTKYLLKTIEPEHIMELNVRAAIALMRGCGITVANLENKIGEKLKDGEMDEILVKSVIDEALWTQVSLSS